MPLSAAGGAVYSRVRGLQRRPASRAQASMGVDGHRDSRCGDEGNAPGAIRTRDLRLRRPTLYPTELRALQKKREANKPGSVSLAGGGSFLWDRGCPTASCSLPGTARSLLTDRRGPRLVPYLALLRVGLAVPLPLPGARWSLTPPFHPCLCPRGPSAVCFLLRCPSPRDARLLAGTLPCGARTFLRSRSLRGPWRGDPHSLPEHRLHLPARALRNCRRVRL